MASTDLLVNTHYKMPWIVWKREYTVPIDASTGYATVSFLHGLPFTPLLIGSWSPNASFSPSYDLTVTIPGGPTGGQPKYFCQVAANSTTVNVTAINNVDSSPKCYLRLMAFAPPDYKGEVTPVDYQSPFRYNSKYRYQKIFMAGRTTGELIHNLGYIPQVRLWQSSLSDSTHAVPTRCDITTQSLTTSSSTIPYWYHVYLDKML